jgi:hypothetical protein
MPVRRSLFDRGERLVIDPAVAIRGETSEVGVARAVYSSSSNRSILAACFAYSCSFAITPLVIAAIFSRSA